MASTYDPTYYENLRANLGDTPHRVSEARFWEMLEVLPPADWKKGDQWECFRVIEAQTADLYTWLVRLGDEHWEMIAPRDMAPYELAARIETARRLEREAKQ